MILNRPILITYISTITIICSIIVLLNSRSISPVSIAHSAVALNGQIEISAAKPETSAQIYLTGIADHCDNPIQSVKTDQGGGFKMKIKEPGIYKLWIGAPHHQMLNIPIGTTGNDREINLNIDPYPHPKIIFDRQHRQFETIFNLSREFEEKYVGYQKSVTTSNNPNTPAESPLHGSDLPARLEKIVYTEKDSYLRQFAAIYLAQIYKMGGRLDGLTCEKILKIIPLDSPLWGIDPEAIIQVTRELGKEQTLSILEEFTVQNPNRKARAKVLARIAVAAKNSGDHRKALCLYEELKTAYRDVEGIADEMAELGSFKKIAPGKPVPGFQIKLYGNGRTLSKKKLLGRYYLLNFRSQTCSACKKELPLLQQIYDKYKGRNLEILSVTLSNDPEEYEDLRTEASPIPWLYSIEERGVESKLARDFEVMQVPTNVLVGPDGVVITAGDDLKGEKITKTLEGVFELSCELRVSSYELKTVKSL
jgi:thiol-disulfide isomerase/thioredoxin